MKTFLIAAAAAVSTAWSGNAEPPVGNLYCPSLEYVGKTPDMTPWCKGTCSQYLGHGPKFLTFCPEAFCKCADPLEPKNEHHCETPRHCANGKYEAVPGSTASDGHCQASCTHNPSACWCTMCRCKNSCRDYEDLVTIKFDEIEDNGRGTRIHKIKGITFGGQSFVLNTAKFETIYGKSGYQIALTSEPNVFFGGFARSAEISVDGGNLRILSAQVAGAWNDNLRFTIEGFDANNNLVGNPYSKTLSSTQKKWLDIDSQTAKKFVFSSSGGVHNNSYRYFGEHFALDNLRVCVPKKLDVERLETQAEIVQKRSDEEQQGNAVGFNTD